DISVAQKQTFGEAGFFFFQAEDGIRDRNVTGVQTCALPISHLISDASLDELHAFAARIGIHRRAFDEDHYDIPTELYDQAIKAGAVPVNGVELVRRLRSSGLRIPARERPDEILPLLLGKCAEAWYQNVTLGEELLKRWSEPHRRYHTVVHLLECLDAIEFLSEK